MVTILTLDVIGDRRYIYDVSSDYPKECVAFLSLFDTTPLKISKEDHIKYLARAKLAGTQIGFGHYMRAKANKQMWALLNTGKVASNLCKEISIDECGKYSDTADATAYAISRLTKQVQGTSERSYSFDTSNFFGLPKPKSKRVKKITWPIP